MKKENEFQEVVKNLEEVLHQIKENNIRLSTRLDFTDFQSTKNKYIVDKYKKSLSWMHSLIDEELPSNITILIKKLQLNNVDKNLKILEELKKHHVTIKPKNVFKLTKIPAEVKDEVRADVQEMQKCFDNECYRSCVILCGRVLEVCLHAKYYKETGFDILEKNPGIGLGKLIAKMGEKGIKLDPGLTQQIHLVNNVRIFSVHKKQRAFHPSKQQTEAIILYTTDVINNLF